MTITLNRLILAIAATWVAVPTVMYFAIPSWGERGQFGDTFGAVNALFSGLAFAGLFWSLRVQQSQLELQRSELELQREELRLQREEMKSSRAELTRQVEVQHALFKATAAQIAVAAQQSRVEALKLEAQSANPSGYGNSVKEINAIAQALSALSDRIERGGPSAA